MKPARIYGTYSAYKLTPAFSTNEAVKGLRKGYGFQIVVSQEAGLCVEAGRFSVCLISRLIRRGLG